MYLNCPSVSDCGSGCEWPCNGRASSSRWGSALYPELLGDASATCDPDLEGMGWKMISLVFIHLFKIYVLLTFMSMLSIILEVFWVFT